MKITTSAELVDKALKEIKTLTTDGESFSTKLAKSSERGWVLGFSNEKK